MAWEENSRICLHMQLIAFLSRIGVISYKNPTMKAKFEETRKSNESTLLSEKKASVKIGCIERIYLCTENKRR